MINGRNQDVEILGRIFHVQTEVTEGDLTSIRTAVFVGGRVVANRDRLVAPEIVRAGEEAVRAEMNSQHETIVHSVVVRARAYQEVRDQTSTTTTAEIAIDLSGVSSSPPVDATEEVAEAIKVRQMLGELRDDLAIDRPLSEGDDLVTRLEQAARRLESFVSQQGFADLRVDEQVRYQLLRERLQRWRAGARDSQQGSRILAEMGRLSSWVDGINRRAELLGYDRELILWALGQLEAGVGPAIVRPRLGSLCGRSAIFDKWLASADPASPELAGMLRRLYAGLGER